MRLTKFPSSEGIVPDRWFVYNSLFVCEQLASNSDHEDERTETYSSPSCNNWPNSGGIVPVSKFDCRALGGQWRPQVRLSLELLLEMGVFTH